jgi:hypothetical protein
MVGITNFAQSQTSLILFSDFRNNHHRFWGKLYKPEDIKVCLVTGVLALMLIIR